MPSPTSTTHRNLYSNDAVAEPPLAKLVTWPLNGRPAHAPLRLVAAAGALAEAISHLPLLMQSLSETPYIGVGFLLLSIAGFLLAQLLVSNDSPAVWFSTAVVAALAMIGYILSRTTGLPQLHDYIGSWGYPLGVVSLVGEGTMLLAALLHIQRIRRAGK